MRRQVQARDGIHGDFFALAILLNACLADFSQPDPTAGQQIKFLSEKLKFAGGRQLGVSKKDHKVSIEIARGNSMIDADQNTVLQPGDVVEVTVDAQLFFANERLTPSN